MVYQSRIFQNRSARQTFWLLIIGVCLIFAAAISVFGVYLSYGSPAFNRERYASSVVKTVFLVRFIPPSQLMQTIKVLNMRGLRLVISQQPLPNATIFNVNVDPKTLHEYIIRHADGFLMSVLLPNGLWLNVRGVVVIQRWLDIAVIISLVVLLIGLITYCIWIINRISLPLGSVARAVKRFGVDVNAPPLALVGTPEMQGVMESFNEMQARIRRLLHDRTQMLAAISHDLRTPITRLQLRAEYLKGSNQYDKAVADLNEMETMISSILSFARDYVRSEAMERFDINALLESICNDLGDVGHQVSYQSDNKRTPYFGRISALKRAFNNLIENAVKYGDRAEVLMKSSKETLQIKISDDGPGIPEDHLEKVFEPFYRVDASRSLQKTGTGLGLAVARDIIRTHGGEIQLYNHEPHGLTVLVTLPFGETD